MVRHEGQKENGDERYFCGASTTLSISPFPIIMLALRISSRIIRLTTNVMVIEKTT